MKVVIRILILVALLCSPGLCGSGDFLGIGARIGVNDGWAYDQNTYLSGLRPGLTAGLFADFWIWKFLSLSFEADYHRWNWSHDELIGSSSVRFDDSYDVISLLPHVNLIIPTVKWRPLLSIGPREDGFVNIVQRDISGSWHNLSEIGHPLATGLSVGVGVISPRFNRFDFSFKIMYNPQFIIDDPSWVPRFQTIDVVLGLVLHPLKARNKPT